MSVVFGRGTHHRRAPDVDQFDPRIRRERVQVDNHQRDRRVPHLGQLAHVIGLVEVREQTRVDGRMQRHDAVSEDRREPRQLGDIGDREPRLGQGAGGPTARHQIPTEFTEHRGELDDAGFVVDRKQGGRHLTTLSTAHDHRIACRTPALRYVARDPLNVVTGVPMATGKLTNSAALTVGGGTLSFLAGFMTWWKNDVGGFTGWHYLVTSGLGVLLLGIVAAVTALRLSTLRVPLPLPGPLPLLAATVLGVLLTVTRFLSDGFVEETDLVRSTGAYAGVLGAGLALVGTVRGIKNQTL